MRWITDIQQLSYYQPGEIPCYCEQLAFPADILLQGILPTIATTGFDLKVYVYSPDGLTEYEDATAYFQWYIGINPNGKRFFNLHANTYSPAMCQYQCWILRVVVTVGSLTVFDQFTDQYCKSTCCDIPRGITFTGGTCEVLVNNIQKIYQYDVANNTSTLLYSGVVNYSDLAILGQRVYARDGFTGNIDVFDWNGTTLTYNSTIGSLPTGAALGADDQYLYLDDAGTIKRLDVNTLTLTTVVPTLTTGVQGDILILNDGSIMVSQDDGSGGTDINIYTGGTLATTYNIPALNAFYGMFFNANILYLMRSNGDVYTLDMGSGYYALYSSYLNSVINNTGWNGAAQRFNCETTTLSAGPEDNINVVETPIPYAVNCGKPLLTIKSTFECIDNETGYYFGIPTQVITGSATFSFSFITNLTARIRREPRTINKITSFNCDVQRSESYKPYLLEGTATEAWLPEWKFSELENMMHGSRIEINDYGIRYGIQSYLLDGDARIGERVYGCWDLFRISIPLRECTIRTDFGCGECADTVLSEILIQNNSSGNYFTQNRELIGDWDEVMDYYEGLGFGIEDTTGTYENTVHSLLISGSNIPYIYADYVSAQNKVYPTTNPLAPVVACRPFIQGIVSGEDMVCDEFTQGIVYAEDTTPETVDVLSIGNWEASGTSSITTITGLLNFTSENPGITTETSFAGEPIGVIEHPGKPTLPRFIDLGSRQISIDTDGIIRFYGEADSFSETGSIITITDVYYDL